MNQPRQTSQSIGWRLLLLTSLAAVCGFAPLISRSAAAEPAPTHGRIQERLGRTIVMVARHDQELLQAHLDQMTGLMLERNQFEQGRAGRLQESLGRAVVNSAQTIQRERFDLKSRIMITRRELNLLSEDSPAGRQTQLGWAVRTAALRAAQGGTPFQAELGQEITRLEKVRQRAINRLQTELTALQRQDAAFPLTIPQRYQEATASARRSMRTADESYLAAVDRRVRELSNQVLRRQSPLLYARLADITREALAPPAGVGGFVEYGLAALAGAIAVMVWFGASTRKDSAAVATTRANPVNEAMPSHRMGSLLSGPATEDGGRKAGVLPQAVTFFSWPREVVFGDHVIGAIGRYADKERIKRALVITSRDLHHDGLLEPLKSSLSNSGIAFRVYDRVEHEVPDTVVVTACEEYRRMATDLIVAVGGGSVIDTAKAVGILATHGGIIQDYEGLDTIRSPLPHFFAVPTTAGCGSESSQFCVVLDAQRKRKLAIISRRLIPQMILIDPTLMVSMSPELTAGSGIDALSNAIEAYLSTWATPLTDGLALHAIRLISETLRAAVADGNNLEARREMAVAAFEAGLAVNNAQCGASHALGHPVAGLFDVPERVSEGILLPHVMRYNLKTNVARMAEVAAAMGEQVEGLTRQEAAEQAITAVQSLLTDIGLPSTFDKVGVVKEAIPALARQAAQDLFLRTNPKTLTQRDIEELYQHAFEGDEHGPASKKHWN